MKISSRSLVYRLAYFPNIVYHNERLVGQLLIDNLTDDEGLGYPPKDNVSLCTLFWRVIFSPVSFVLMCVVVPIVTVMIGVAIAAIVLLCFGMFVAILPILGLNFLIKKVPIKRVRTVEPSEVRSASLGDLIRVWYEGRKEMLCPTIQVVE